MKLERIKCKPFIHAWDLIVSDSYLIGCTGKRVAVLDREYQLLHTIEGLDYVYSADVSPDEKKLLLISNDNKFYITDFESGEKIRVTVKSPYNYNLEGRGCWSFDGKSIFILVMNNKTLHSALRCYCADDLTQYRDSLTEEYVLSEIHRLNVEKKYLLIGSSVVDKKQYFLYYDGCTYTRYPLENSESMVIFRSDVDENTGKVTLYTTQGCYRYSAEGEFLKEIRYHNLKENDDIQKYAHSSCGNYIYLASKSGFYLIDAKTEELIAYVPEEYGVQNFEQVAPDVIALATWSGVKLYRY